MVYWRKDYFKNCSDIIGKGKDTGPREFLGELWKWVGQQIEMGDDSIVSMDNRRVVIIIIINNNNNNNNNNGGVLVFWYIGTNAFFLSNNSAPKTRSIININSNKYCLIMQT
jgi:hypothetical protein